MSRRRYISTEISIDAKLNKVSDFAALFYTWAIPHARDDCRIPATISANRRISPQNAEELLFRVVPGRKKTIAQVQKVLEELVSVSLLGIDENGEIYYPSHSFYKFQTYINAANRRETPQNAVSSSSSLSSSPSLKEEEECPLKPKDDTWPSPFLLIKLYNEKTCGDFSAVEKITEGRLRKASAYLRQFPQESFWCEVFDEMNKSFFLRGQVKANGHGPFKADFDWLLTKGKDGTENAAKVFEGKYRNG